MPALDVPESSPPWVVSIRDLAEFVLRRGGLSRSTFRSARRAQEGTRGHQDIQRQRPPNYQAEIPVRHQFRTPSGATVVVQGRIDGVLRSAGRVLLEEIKTVAGDWNGEPRDMHWAQAKIYAALLAQQESLPALDIQLTYLHLDTNDLSVFRQHFEAEALDTFYRGLTDVYGAWIDLQNLHRKERDLSIQQAPFPFAQPRQGQAHLQGKTRETLQSGATLLAEAPTGIGKTISVLLAGLQELAVSQGKLKLAYLTAKTTGHDSAEKAVQDLSRIGVRLRALAFAARDRLCFGQPDGSPCDPETCPFAQRHFDHRHEALRHALDLGWTGLNELRALGKQHHVCPSALALDLVPWVDLVVCDYNYVFDPSVRLAALVSDAQRQVALLIDEAHNLPDRARQMFGASISTPPLLRLKQGLGKGLAAGRHALEKILAILDDTAQREGVNRRALVLPNLPRGLRSAITSFLAAADHALSRGQLASLETELLEVYFQLSGFLRLLEWGDERTHVLLLETVSPSGRRKDWRLRWLCLDPGPLLEKVYRETGPAVIFSATLSPAAYFERLLGHTPQRTHLQLPSPFPPENLGLMIHPGITTSYRHRAGSYQPLAETLATFAVGKKGHYLAFFSSYDYLRQVETILRSIRTPGLRILSQNPSMDLEERQAFLKHFRQPPTPRSRTSLLGLAVLGGVFAEGVDLVGTSLIGVAVVGVGLPQVNLENDLIKERFSEDDSPQETARGFDFAYTYPGFNRVLQAVGRLIRSESDRGVALLIDTRYRQHRYRQLFPPWWRPHTVQSLEDITDFQEAFWNPPKRPLPPPSSP